MIGAWLATACPPPSPERNQRAPRTARASAAATKPTATRGGDFRGGGDSFLFDLFLDFLLIEMIPLDRYYRLPWVRASLRACVRRRSVQMKMAICEGGGTLCLDAEMACLITNPFFLSGKPW